jgi:Relaxase/Mobilisation nuclease domain/Large polyvalent protein-associated domain 7
MHRANHHARPFWRGAGARVCDSGQLIRMIPHVPDQRKFKSNASKPFDDLISYLQAEQEHSQGVGLEKPIAQRHDLSSKFDDLLNYATSPLDKDAVAPKCIAVRTHGVRSIATASVEMNAVAKQNPRCHDPAYHIILSWPEHETPPPDAIFDAAEHALKKLGLDEHQYVLAIHGDTDNIHCHISVNRVHPTTFKSRHIARAWENLHEAARQSEIKHGWSHDNGIWVVEVDGHGKKHVVLNKDRAAWANSPGPHAHHDLGTEAILPPWHDPDSLDSWLKTKVAKALARALPDLDGWPALHAWLSDYSITLNDTGGGGMRLSATSPDSGEILNIAASKGLRLLKRAELEKRWGPYANSLPIAALTPDLSHLTPQQLAKGIADVINRSNPQHDLGHPGRPPEHVLRAQQHRPEHATEKTRGLHEMPDGGLDDEGQGPVMPLSNAVHDGVGDPQTGHDTDVRRAGAGTVSSRSQRSLNRDTSLQAERKEERAAARANLRQRFSQYKVFVGEGDSQHYLRSKDIALARSLGLKQIKAIAKAAKAAIPRAADVETRLVAHIEIDAESLRRKLALDASHQSASRTNAALRTPPLSWRAWLYEQSQLGDQAALSALRGIVYQAGRDAKKADTETDEVLEVAGWSQQRLREEQYKKVMARLLDEEKREVAIRAANSAQMRPYEADALLSRYTGIQWRVTGNGNVAYSDQAGEHLFTDRGNRVTFDRAHVTDADIRMALAHAQQKFGNQLTLTGDDRLFSERMARIAEDMGMAVLNPELQTAISSHKTHRVRQAAAAVDASVIEEAGAAPTEAQTQQRTPQEKLQAMVLAIDPLATFVTPAQTAKYVGKVAATLGEAGQGFAQHTGRGVYVLHKHNPPHSKTDVVVEVRYRHGVVNPGDKDRGL